MELRGMVRPIFQLAFVSVAGLIIYLSLTQHLPLPEGAHSDKVGHLLAFFALQLSGGIGFKRGAGTWFALAFGICLGLGLEAAQLFVPSRDASMADMVANLAGIALALAMLGLASRYANSNAREG